MLGRKCDGLKKNRKCDFCKASKICRIVVDKYLIPLCTSEEVLPIYVISYCSYLESEVGTLD